MTAPDDLVILTAAEVAQLLRVDRKTVYEAVQLGMIPHCRVGRRVIFERGAVLAWFRESTGIAAMKPKQ